MLQAYLLLAFYTFQSKGFEEKLLEKAGCEVKL